MIHETAIVSEAAVIGAGVEIGPFAIIEKNVEIGANSKIGGHAVLKSGTRVGVSVVIESFSVIAGLPQDLSFDPACETYVRIGDRTIIREGSTLNRATQEGKATSVGEDCFLMAVSHLGHDCVVGNSVVIGNNSLLAGFVTVGDKAFLGGRSGVHQFCRVGKGVMFGGGCEATQDVPPFTMLAGRNELFGLNLVGLRRRGVSREAIRSLKFCYSQVFGRPGNIRKIAEGLEGLPESESEEAKAFLAFFNEDEHGRGFARPHRKTTGSV